MSKSRPLKVWSLVLGERAPNADVAAGWQSAALVVARNQRIAASLARVTLSYLRTFYPHPLRLDIPTARRARALSVVGNPPREEGVWISTSANTIDPPAGTYVKVR